MQKEKDFPLIVQQVLKDMQKGNDADLPIMQMMTRNEDALKNMWRHILRSKRQELYAGMSERDVVYSFIKTAIDSMKKEIPVFYLNEKKKSAKIEQILKAQEKLKKVYVELFAEEATPFIGALQANEAAAIEKINGSYLRASGAPKVRKVHTFIREMAQINLLIYGEQLPSVIRTAALALYSYTINQDANILKIIQGEGEEPLSFEDQEYLLSGQ